MLRAMAVSGLLAAQAPDSARAGSLPGHLADLKSWADEKAQNTSAQAPPAPPPMQRFTFAHVYTDSMVLQRAPHSASIWGWSTPGAKVTVSIEKKGAAQVSQSAVANTKGQWRVSLPPQPASSEPVKSQANDSTETIEVSDVLFGDVFVCSGQVSCFSLQRYIVSAILYFKSALCRQIVKYGL